MDIWTLEFEVDKAQPTPYWGSLMHGMLMQRLPEEVRERAHNTEPRPFSQWVEPLNGYLFRWHVNTLTPDMGEAMATAFDASPDWDCRHVGCVFHMTSCERKTMSIREYTKAFYLSDKPPSRMIMRFHTTTTHKTQGGYAMFPSVELAARSLRSRLCAIEPGFVLAEDDVLEQIISHTRIARYRLQSGSFALEGARVQGYTGEITLSVHGPDPMIRLAGTLFCIAPYCGVGVKTALGMGGCSVDVVQERSPK